MLGQIFTHEMKPMEVEILVAEISLNGNSSSDQLFHILYDGTVKDHSDFAVLGGDAEVIFERFSESYTDNLSLASGIESAIQALAGPERILEPDDLEVAELSHANGRRSFRRIEGEELLNLMPK